MSSTATSSRQHAVRGRDPRRLAAAASVQLRIDQAADSVRALAHPAHGGPRRGSSLGYRGTYAPIELAAATGDLHVFGTSLHRPCVSYVAFAHTFPERP